MFHRYKVLIRLLNVNRYRNRHSDANKMGIEMLGSGSNRMQMLSPTNKTRLQTNKLCSENIITNEQDHIIYLNWLLTHTTSRLLWNIETVHLVEITTVNFLKKVIPTQDRFCDSHWHQTWHCTLDICAALYHSVSSDIQDKRHGSTWSAPHLSFSPCRKDRSVAPEQQRQKKSSSLTTLQR